MTQNILFITTYTGMGGGESLQINLMRALDRERYALHLLTPSGGKFPANAASIGVTTHVLPYRGTSTFFVPALWRHAPIVGKLQSFLANVPINGVISDYHSLPFVVPAAHAQNIPVLWNAMGWWFPIHPWQRRFFDRDVDRIIAITGAVKEKLLGTPPKIRGERIDVLIPGVDPAVYHPGVDGSPVRNKIGIDNDVPLVALIARFQNVKGHEYFLEMAKHVLQAIPDARFAVAGENVFAVSKDEDYKKSILAQHESDPILRDRVTYLGFWDDAREVIAAADVMVCSSWFESLSMVALESMSMARPIVSTRVGGPSETIRDGETGFLVPPRDARALADKVIALLRDADLRRRMGAAGREHVAANFSARRYARQIESIIDALIANPTR